MTFLLRALRLEMPVAAWEGNLLLDTTGGIWACYELDPWHYELIPTPDRLAHFRALQKLMTQFAEYEGQALVVPAQHTVAEHYARLRRRLGGPLAGAAERLLQQSEAYVRQLMTPAEALEGEEGEEPPEPVEYRHFLLLKLPPRRPDLQGLRALLADVVQRPAAALAALGTGIPEVVESDWRAALLAEQELQHRLRALLPVRPVEGETLQWLLRRPFWRGLGEPPLRPGWRPTVLLRAAGGQVRLAPAPSEVVTLAEGLLGVRLRHLVVEQDTPEGERRSYQAFLALSQLPDRLVFPGCEWAYHLQDLDFPVEVSIRWRMVDNQKAREVVRGKAMAVQAEAEHAESAGDDLPLTLREAYEQGLELQRELEVSRTPLAWVSVLLCVAHHTEEGMRERVGRLADFFAPDIEVQRPAGDQLLAFVEMLPGAGRRMRDYVHRWLPQVVAGSMWAAGRTLGDGVGYFVGTTGSRGQPVYHDPMRAPQVARAPGQVALGPLGSGKSFVLNCNICRAILFDPDTRGLIFDPKGERGHWPEKLPELAGHIEVVTFSADPRHTGKLDPFALFRRLGEAGLREAEMLAVEYLAFLARATPGDATYTAILKACEVARRSRRPSLRAALEALGALCDGRPEVRDKVEYLHLLAGKAYAHLLFGEDPDQGLDVTGRLSILQFQGLSLPPADKRQEEYNTLELLTSAVLNGAVAFMAAFSRQSPHLKKIHLIDEAWAVLKTSVGLNQVLHLIRTGRSTNNAAWLATQNARDLLDEGIRAHLPVKWVYRTTDPAEARAVLDLLGLEHTEENLRLLAELHVSPEPGGPRECLHQDLYGRCGRIWPECEFEHWLECFNTTPGRRNAP